MPLLVELRVMVFYIFEIIIILSIIIMRRALVIKEFVNRQEELDFLEKEYQRDTSSLVIQYGRRRVEKQSLQTSL